MSAFDRIHPANTIHWPNAGTRLAHCLQSWTALPQHRVNISCLLDILWIEPESRGSNSQDNRLVLHQPSQRPDNNLQGLNFKSCVWRAMSSHSSHHPQEVLNLACMCTKVAWSPIHFISCLYVFTNLVIWLAIVHVPPPTMKTITRSQSVNTPTIKWSRARALVMAYIKQTCKTKLGVYE